jgi:hypothetical protein
LTGRSISVHGKKSQAIFSRPRLRFRRQKAWFLPPAASRSYARADFFKTTPAFPAAKSVVFAACRVA